MSNNKGLSIARFVAIAISISAGAAGERNFGNSLILGDSSVIDTTERLRPYTSLTQVGNDFGGSAPEFLAASLYFGQSPQPAQCYIGRWARTASNGVLRGGELSTAAQTLANFTAVVSGGLDITVDGTPHALAAINLSAAGNLNAVAELVQAALTGSATVIWDSNNAQFVITSASTGASSAVSFGSVPGSGTDLSVLMGLTAVLGAYTSAGIVAESPLTAVLAMASASNDWYALTFGAATPPATSDYQAVAAFIEGSPLTHYFAVTSQDPNVLNAQSTSDVAYLLQQAGYNRTLVQYSSTTPFATASWLGRASTVDYEESDSTITMMFKQQPGVTPETLSDPQANALLAKNCNVYALMTDGTADLMNGTMASGQYFDVITGADWLQSDMQQDVYDYFRAQNKVNQTDPGVNAVIGVLTLNAEKGVANGYIAPGVWEGPPVGPLVTGQTLTQGYFFYAPPISTQSPAQRQTRITPPIQAAIKLAGAFHGADIGVNINP
jgi:hypothetical protein